MALTAGPSAVLLAVLSACGQPPELAPTPTVPAPLLTAPPASPTPTLPPGFTLPPTTPPTADPAPSFAENSAVPCDGRPDASAVIALVRRSGALPSGGSRARAANGPLCAGTWQYTVLTVPGKEPLQVVSEGRPDALRLVTAGTDVCTVDVRAGAPIGILQAASC
jgi:hypothetical protein